MNIYLIQPYNAYAKPRKKTPQEIIFEQNEIAEMEYKVLQEELHSRTLPNNSPAIAAPTAGPMQGMAAGGGGQPNPEYFHPAITNISFSAQPTTGVAPLTVQFTNQSSFDALVYDNWAWSFGDGTTGVGISPVHLYPTGTFSVSLTGSSTDPYITTSQSFYLNVASASIPTVVANLTPINITGSLAVSNPFFVTFTNLTSNYSMTQNTYKWIFSGSTSPVTPVTTSVAVNPTIAFYNTGSYSVKLEATGSWNLTGSDYNPFNVLITT